MSHAKQPCKKSLDLDSIREQMRTLISDGHSDEAIAMVVAMLLELQKSNTELVLKILQMERERAGHRSERLDPAQLALMLELAHAVGSQAEDMAATEAEDKALEQERAELGEAAARRGVPRRRRPSRELERRVILHRLEPEERLCPCCGEPMGEIGEDVSELVELVPAQFFVEEHHRFKYACGRCKETVVTAPGPVKLIEKGLPGAGLLAHVVVSKYQEHLPLNRLVDIYLRGGLETSSSTLCGWVAAVARDMEPIVERIWEKARVGVELQIDGSGLKVLDRDDPQGIRRGTMWCYVSDRRNVVFRFTPDGCGATGPWKELEGRCGYVQADAANVFDRVYEDKNPESQAIEVGCLFHARRKLFAMVDSDPRVAYPLKLIAQLYQVEDLADRRGLAPPERLELRKRRSAKIVERYHRWLAYMVRVENPESRLGKACLYSLRHWAALTRFLSDGVLPLDNSLCEQQIRSLAVGRRNYLFAGSDEGARRAATLYSVMRTCALNRVDPFAYLVDVLRKLASGWPQSRLDELLPENWKPATAV